MPMPTVCCFFMYSHLILSWTSIPHQLTIICFLYSSSLAWLFGLAQLPRLLLLNFWYTEDASEGLRSSELAIPPLPLLLKLPVPL